jgi:GDP-L-fucose synthase
MKSILIIGSNGFIGSNILEFLNNFPGKYNIYSPKKFELDVIEEKSVFLYLKKHYFDVIIHAAVYNPRIGNDKDTNKEIDFNLRMFLNFEKHSNLFGKMLYLGSGAEFDKRQNIKMITEDDLTYEIPNSNYGFYKYVINKIIISSKNIINLRIFGLFGKYEDWRRTFISNLCCKAIKNIPLTIRQNLYFDYLYIDDFCRIIEWFINNDSIYKSYNVTSGSRIDLLTIAKIVNEISCKNLPIYIGKEGLGNEYTSSNERLRKEINNLELTPIDKSIESLYKYYLEIEQDIDLLSLLYQ